MVAEESSLPEGNPFPWWRTLGQPSQWAWPACCVRLPGRQAGRGVAARRLLFLCACLLGCLPRGGRILVAHSLFHKTPRSCLCLEKSLGLLWAEAVVQWHWRKNMDCDCQGPSLCQLHCREEPLPPEQSRAEQAPLSRWSPRSPVRAGTLTAVPNRAEQRGKAPPSTHEVCVL